MLNRVISCLRTSIGVRWPNCRVSSVSRMGFPCTVNSGMKFDFEKRYSWRTLGMYGFFYRMTLCVKRGTNRRPVSARLWHCVVSKRLQISSNFLRCQIAISFLFLFLVLPNSKGNPQHFWFSTEIAVYLGNGMIYAYCCYGALLGVISCRSIPVGSNDLKWPWKAEREG